MYQLDDFQSGQILLVNKPLEWTSFQVVNKIHWLLRKRFDIKKIKVGHAGTLDPLATGLLIVCTGKKTKQIQNLIATDKTYTGTICLGATTPSYDLETEVVPKSDPTKLTEEDINHATRRFVGNIQQKPPLFSAIKQKGKRLYKHARAGERVEIKSREVIVYDFEITKINLPIVAFRIRCGKGTYIRTIAHDFGQALGVGGYLKSLCRTATGNHNLSDSVTIETFEKSLYASS
ncbi:tRNA pseudouridine(55) synthase TruB [Flavobacteriaceae bacterium]|nr:tRNA pseudouridine(55) synthase TruB [Flavobacteriaceae bacterium]